MLSTKDPLSSHASTDNPLTFLGRTTFRNQGKVFGIRKNDRCSHMYIVGKSGTGKSTLLEFMIRQDVINGNGVAVLDPHGDLVESVRRFVPKERKNDLIYLNPADSENQITFNPLWNVPADNQALVASGIVEAFKNIWHDTWGPRTEHLLRNALLALLEVKTANFSHITELFINRGLRGKVLTYVKNEQVRKFWLKEYPSYSKQLRQNAIAPIQNKVGAFLSNPVLAGVLLGKGNSLDINEVLNSKKILLANLSKGTIGEDSSQLLGSLLVTAIGQAGLARSSVPRTERSDFYLYADEFQNFTTLSSASMLSELRKYACAIHYSNQFLSQVSKPIRDAVLGNVGTLISFRVGASDATKLEKEFGYDIRARDLVNTPNHHMVVKLIVDDVTREPFSAETVNL